MEVYTIGFTKKNAAEFFGLLRGAGVERLLDIRLNNSSQLAGFAKRGDLEFFLREIGKIDYVHEPLLAPTQPMIDDLKKKKGEWEVFERDFIGLMVQRRIEEELDRDLFDVPTVLLCSEATAEHCHRRLVLEYLKNRWGNIEIIHL